MDSTPRSPGAALSPPSAAVATPRDRLLICVCILLVTALAWVYLIHLARHTESPIDAYVMAKMGMATNLPWTASDVPCLRRDGAMAPASGRAARSSAMA